MEYIYDLIDIQTHTLTWALSDTLTHTQTHPLTWALSHTLAHIHTYTLIRP